MTGRFASGVIALVALLAAPCKAPEGGFLWPTGSGFDTRPLGMTYGQFATGPALHLGIDVLENAGTPVYAVESGWVTHQYTTSPTYSGLAISPDDSLDEVIVYRHLDPESIPFSVGDHVRVDDVVGEVAEFSSDYDHVHFARLTGVEEADRSKLPQDAKAKVHPLALLAFVEDTVAPTFEPVTAGGPRILFREHELNNAQILTPDGLRGAVDVIVRVRDRLAPSDPVAIVPYEVSVEILDLGDDSVVLERTIRLDGPFATGWAATEAIYAADLSASEFAIPDDRAFCFVVTNGTADPDTDPPAVRADGWDTSALRGAYRITVTASDLAGNEATPVTTTVDFSP